MKTTTVYTDKHVFTYDDADLEIFDNVLTVKTKNEYAKFNMSKVEAVETVDPLGLDDE